MRFYLLDSAIIRPHGHHDHFARGFLSVAREYLCEPVICANRSVKAELQGELGARPVFTRSMYHPASTDPWDGVLTDFRVRSRQFMRDLQALSGAVAPEDVLLLPTAVPAEIFGLAEWLRTEGAKPRVAAYFHRAEPGPLTSGGLVPALLRTVARTLGEAAPADVWVGATNHNLGEALSPILGRPVQVAPSVTFYNDAPVPPPAPPADGRPIRVGFLGSARGEKGADVIPELVHAAAAADLPMRFIVQCHGADIRLPESYRGLQQDPRTELLARWLTDEEMVGLIDSLDIVAMPYDRARYASMVSGVFTLAVGHGKPALVPSDTWMAEQVESGDAVGTVYRGEGVGDVLDALRGMCADLPALSRRAVEAAPPWREKNSGETMVRQLMEWAGVPVLAGVAPSAARGVSHPG